MEFVEVTESEFFAFMGPRDVYPEAHREHSIWYDRSRCICGKTSPGYGSGCHEERRYYLAAAMGGG